MELILAVVGGLIEEVGVHEEGGAGDKRDENENLDRVDLIDPVVSDSIQKRIVNSMILLSIIHLISL